MSPRRTDPDLGLEQELDDSVEPGELPELKAVAARLSDEDPYPAAAFRARLHRRLRAGLAESPGPRPPRLRLLVAAYACSGFGLLVLAALGAAGSGPLAV